MTTRGERLAQAIEDFVLASMRGRAATTLGHMTHAKHQFATAAEKKVQIATIIDEVDSQSKD